MDMQKFAFLLSMTTLTSLTPAFSQAPSNYYAATANLSGSDLAHTLSTISADSHRPLSYHRVWSALQQTDEDPTNPENILTLYTGQSLPKTCMKGHAHKGCRNTWDREHTWPKSHGFPRKNQWAYTDLHHLRATIPRCNAARGNLDFDDGGQPITGCASRLNKTRKFQTWEPPQTTKGDIARMLFYMAIRYDGMTPFDHTPDLKLVDQTTKSGIPKLGKLCTLLRWHEEDPISDIERQRNNVVAELQGNRNPFIDEPSFARRLWGETCAR